MQLISLFQFLPLLCYFKRPYPTSFPRQLPQKHNRAATTQSAVCLQCEEMMAAVASLLQQTTHKNKHSAIQ